MWLLWWWQWYFDVNYVEWVLNTFDFTIALKKNPTWMRHFCLVSHCEIATAIIFFFFAVHYFTILAFIYKAKALSDFFSVTFVLSHNSTRIESSWAMRIRHHYPGLTWVPPFLAWCFLCGLIVNLFLFFVNNEFNNFEHFQANAKKSALGIRTEYKCVQELCKRNYRIYIAFWCYYKEEEEERNKQY